MFDPWIGKHWGQPGNAVGGVRLLVLGESHYCSQNPTDIVGQCKSDWTKEVVEDYLLGETYRFFTGITQVVSGRLRKNISKEDLREIWESIAFYNYVPVFAASKARVSPTDEMFAAGKGPLATLCADKKPEAILICGFRLHEVLWKDFATGPSEKSGGSPFYGIHGATATYIQHPSSGFSTTAWRPRIVELLGRVAETRRTTVGATTEWSEELKAQTRDILGGHEFIALQGDLFLKHSSAAFGAVALDDLLNAHLRVVDQGSGEIFTFSSVDDLIAAGWVID